MNDFFVTFLASFLIWVMVMGFLAVWIIGKRIEGKQVVHIIYSVAIAWFIAEVIKYVVPTLRPFQLFSSVPLTLTVPGDPAFPSTHAAIAFGLASGLVIHRRRLGIVFLALAVAVGVGRILSNVHFPIDIAGGAVLGSSTAFILRRFVV